MRIKKNNNVAIGTLFAVLLMVSWSIVGSTQTKIESTELLLEGKANKETFILGEPVSIEFEISNKGKTSIAVHSGGVETGFLKIFIAAQNGEYKEYLGYGWGLKMGRMINLAPGESHKYKEATILWHGKIDVSGLSQQAAREKLKGKITTEYAFPEPGVYLIKGISYFGENATLIESEPIEIVVNAPAGDDLKIWNQIKGNREIALLMQAGEFNTSKDEEKEKLVGDVEQIIVQYPNSIYSSYLRTNLEKYKASEEKRNEFMRKIRQP